MNVDNVAVLRALLAVAIGGLVAGCAPPLAPVTVTPSQAVTFVIPTALSNGRIDVTIRPSFVIGSSAMISMRIGATRGTIIGPVAARILASGIGERGSAAEVLVATLAVTPVTVRAGQSLSTTVTWDGRDAKGELVPADAYSLRMDFRVEDGTVITNATAGATLQWDLATR